MESAHWDPIIRTPMAGESGDDKRGGMLIEAYEKAKSFYQPYNDRLAEITGNQVFRWA